MIIAISSTGPTLDSQLDPKRPAELHHLRGHSDKARKELGWQPKVGFEELVRMMVDADLERVGREIAAR